MAGIILSMYIIAGTLAAIFGTMVTFFETEYETNILIIAFHLQIETIKYLRDDVNMAGIIIVMIVETIFLLPCNIILLSTKICDYAIKGAWSLFKKIFKRRKHERI